MRDSSDVKYEAELRLHKLPVAVELGRAPCVWRGRMEQKMDLIALLGPGRNGVISRTIISYLGPAIAAVAQACNKLAVVFLRDGYIVMGDLATGQYFESANVRHAVDGIMDQHYGRCRVGLGASPLRMVCMPGDKGYHRLVVDPEHSWDAGMRYRIFEYMSVCFPCDVHDNSLEYRLKLLIEDSIQAASMADDLDLYTEVVSWVEREPVRFIGYDRLASPKSLDVRGAGSAPPSHQEVAKHDLLTADGYAVLAEACKHGSIRVLDELHKLGVAASDLRDNRCIRCLPIAVRNGQLAILRCLRATWNFDQQSLQSSNMLLVARKKTKRLQKGSAPWHKRQEILDFVEDWLSQSESKERDIQEGKRQSAYDAWEELRIAILKDAFDLRPRTREAWNSAGSTRPRHFQEVYSFYKETWRDMENSKNVSPTAQKLITQYELHQDRDGYHWDSSRERIVFALRYAWFDRGSSPSRNERAGRERAMALTWFQGKNPTIAEVAVEYMKLLHTFCNHCLVKGPVSKCGGCKRAYYCCNECQREAWRLGHKDECKLIAARSYWGIYAAN